MVNQKTIFFLVFILRPTVKVIARSIIPPFPRGRRPGNNYLETLRKDLFLKAYPFFITHLICIAMSNYTSLPSHGKCPHGACLQ